MIRAKYLLPTLSLLAAFSAAVYSHSAAVPGDHEDDFLYNQMATIEGTVQILNHPELGRTPAGNRETVLFQRADCKKCVVAAVTDQEGRYELRVRQGRYRVIMRDGSREGELEDALAPGQPRYVEATSPIQPAKFDINIVLPKR